MGFRFVLLFVALGALVQCAPVQLGVGLDQPRPVSQDADEIAFAKAVLDSVQPASIDQNREFCGFIGVDASGDLVATTPRAGREASCLPNLPPVSMTVLASYHSHAAHSPRFDSEVPSVTDLEADAAEAIDGYVGTPGGRVWYHDARAGRTRMLCGPGCITADPAYDPADTFPLSQSYSAEELVIRDRVMQEFF
ncbi:MAG: DUF4329 domain-containing protein [Marinibacterium sp.]|nr:DUF4329 domain-containing protein [Marinibacterium sp.]